MADKGAGPETVKALEDGRALQVAPRDAVAHGNQQRGNPVHSGTAYPHEMEAERSAVQVRQLLAGPGWLGLSCHWRLAPLRSSRRVRPALGEHALQRAAP